MISQTRLFEECDLHFIASRFKKLGYGNVSLMNESLFFFG